jgi:type IV pilus assembly protein PilW
MNLAPIRASRMQGFSLIELMIALTIGLLLLAGLVLIFVNSSQANRELQKTAQQIENGRYAIDVLTQNLRHAGFYGHLFSLPVAPASADPCEVADTAKLHEGLAFPLQGFRAPDFATRADVSATSCDDKGLLTAANLRPGSDVLVVRRASTAVATTGTVVTNDIYIQATSTIAQIQVGNSSADLSTQKADGSAATLYLRVPPPPAAPVLTPSPVRKYHVHVYFVAPCSRGTAANEVCQAGDDSIPTLKRLELSVVGGNTAMRVVPLVEGVEFFKIEYGFDWRCVDPAATPSCTEFGTSTSTGMRGDSQVDGFGPTPAAVLPAPASAIDWTFATAAKIYVLARNTEPTTGHADDKSYVLGSVTVTPADYAGAENYRRHVFTSAVRIVNAAGRREIP